MARSKSSFENVQINVTDEDLAVVEDILDLPAHKIAQDTPTEGQPLPAPVKPKGYHGRWAPGVSGNPQGRPRRTVEMRLLTRLARAVFSDDKMGRMCDNVADKAAEGDLDYVRFVFSYLVGTPVARTDVNITSGQDTLATWLADLRETEDMPPEIADPISNLPTPDRHTTL